MDRSPRPPRRFTAVGAGLLSAALLSAGGGGSLGGDDDGDSGSESGTVTVGLSYPQSGVYAPLGEDIRQGFDLYLEQNDGVLGGHEVELVTADEGENPQVGVPATERLITQDGADVVIGIVNSATALGLRDAFDQNEVPLILANAGANEITESGSDYIWRSSYRNGDVSGAIGPHVAEEVGDGSVYLIAADYAAGEEHLAGFREAFEEAGGTIAGETLTPFGTTSDWQPYLAEIRSSGADAVFAFYAGAEAANFVQQFDQFGLSDEMQLYGNGFLVEGDLLDAQGESAIGIQTSLPYSDQIDTDVNREFVEAYTEAYDEVPTIYALSAYDAAAAADAAIEAADSVDGPGIAAALGEIGEIDSPRGPWSFDENHDPLTPYYIREVQDVDGVLTNVIIGTSED
jgi:branched-chain amino acid transport system substrate-binding protein